MTIFPQDSYANQEGMGSATEQILGNLARKNATKDDYHICLAETFAYVDSWGQWDLRPCCFTWMLRLEGTPKWTPKWGPPDWLLVLNPNNNIGNPTFKTCGKPS